MNEIELLRVLADHPTDLDMLGFGSVSSAVSSIVLDSDEPVAVGLHGPWGSGKSSLLQFVKADLSQHSRVRVIEVNPWEFDDHADVKGTLIGLILGQLEEAAENAGLGEKLKGMFKRISWTRAAGALARGALTMQWDPEKLLDAFSPQPPDGSPSTMAGFREDFAELLEGIDCDKVVLLVDDLDRCLPSAVLATLEAVKLFLSVPKMAFVIAADQEMVREAIVSGLGDTRRSSAFARDYIDKIIQVPVWLPQPTPDDAACYVALLLGRRSGLTTAQLAGAIAHAVGRRASGSIPYLADAADIKVEYMTLADRAVAGLGSVDVVNPRRVKRFLNALAVRQHAASQAGVDLKADVVAKLFLIEHRHPELIKALAAKASADRTGLLASWESWATNLDKDLAAPAMLTEEMRPMLATEPLLASVDTGTYFELARRFLNVRVASALSKTAQTVLTDLLSGAPGARTRGADKLASLTPDDRYLMGEHLVSAAHSAADPNLQLVALLDLVPHGLNVESFSDVVRTRRGSINPGTGLALAKATEINAELKTLAGQLAQDGDVNEMTRAAIANVLAG